MALRDLLKRRKKKTSVPTKTSTFGLPAPKETVLTQAAKSPTITQQEQSIDTVKARRGSSFSSILEQQRINAQEVLRREAEKRRLQREAIKRTEERRKEAEKKRLILLEVKKNLERQKREEFEKEMSRIERQKDEIKEQGGRINVKVLKDSKTKAPIITKTTLVDKIVNGKKIKQRIFETFNVKTGVRTIKTFKLGKQTGGVVSKIDRTVDTSQTTKKQKKKEKKVDKVIEKLTSSLERAKLKSNFAKSEVYRSGEDFGVKVELAKRGEITPEELKKATQRRISSTIKSFGRKSIEQANSAALGLALLTKVPGLLKTKEGRIALGVALTSLPKEVVSSVRSLGTLTKTSPEQAAGVIATEMVLFATGSKVLKETGKLSKTVLNRVANLNPFLLKVQKGLVKIPARKGGQVLKVGTIKEGQESVAKALARGGTKATAVTAQANRLVGFIKRKKIIEKPLPVDETRLSKRTLALLKRFDQGKLEAKEIIDLNKRLREESKRLVGGQEKGIDLLERSTYFDPDRLLRKSRLAIKDEAIAEGSFLDLITGRATLFSKKAKPQVLILEGFIERLPKTKEFRTIARKLKRSKVAGKDPNLTPNELAKLSRWQVTPSGKLKPIGSTTFKGGLEREVTIAPGEIIRRVKKLGTLKINNKRIPIVAVKILKGKEKVSVFKKVSKSMENLDSLLKRKSKLKTKDAINNIDKVIKKESENILSIEKKKALKEINEMVRVRRKALGKRVYPTNRKALQSLLRIGRGIKPRARPRKTPRVTPRPKGRVKPRIKPKVKGRVTPRKTPRLTPRPKGRVTPRKTPRPTPRPSPIAKKKKIIRRKTGKKVVKKKQKKEQGYDVKARPLKKKGVKTKPKLIKVNKVPLSKKRAEDLRNYVTDTSLSRSAKLSKSKGKPKKPSISVPLGYKSKSNFKFRNYKIVKGKRVKLKSGAVIEKRKRLLDTKQEKKKITLKKRIAQLNKKAKSNKLRTTKTTKRKKKK